LFFDTFYGNTDVFNVCNFHFLYDIIKNYTEKLCMVQI
ncbi:MAG: hypothetical protein JG772_815, partial [Dysgonamonadaceae bacterium]|nr:hypothetical protein [Dysgonamonadaceae bacterium]